MALVQTYTKVVLTFKDQANTKATTYFWLPVGGAAYVDAGLILDAADQIQSAIAPISGCTLMKQSVIFGSLDRGITPAAEVEGKGDFTFVPTTGTPYKIEVPGFNMANVDADDRTITTNLAATVGTGAGQIRNPVKTFINLLLNANPGGFAATNDQGIPLQTCLEGHFYTNRSLKERRGRTG
jgi:hypothetical protein